MGPPWESQGSGLGIVGSGRFGDWFILQWVGGFVIGQLHWVGGLVIGLYCSGQEIW